MTSKEEPAKVDDVEAPVRARLRLSCRRARRTHQCLHRSCREGERRLKRWRRASSLHHHMHDDVTGVAGELHPATVAANVRMANEAMGTAGTVLMEELNCWYRQSTS